MQTKLVSTTAQLVSYSRQITPMKLLDFLRLGDHTHQARIFWENSEIDLAFAGFGVAAEITASGQNRFDEVRQKVDDLFLNAILDSPRHEIRPRLFGGFAFQAEHEENGIWSAFPSAYFVLPRYLLTQSGSETWLTISACVGTDAIDQLRFEADQLAIQLSQFTPTTDSNPLLQLDYPLGVKDWRKQIHHAIALMQNGDLEKVVLSRTADLTFQQPIDPLMALAHLETRYSDCYRFLIEPRKGHAFFGATPELITSIQGRRLETAALAGSTRRGKTETEDEMLGEQLLTSDKDRREHQFVVDALLQILKPLTVGELDAPTEPCLRRLSNIQHLYTPIVAHLNHPIHAIEILEHLHPTPALGGTPRALAMDTIREVELIARGWYAAPVGWIDADGDGTFAVAIRSAVSHDQTARLYAGAGIVIDSDPDKEWDETALKFRPMLEALGAKWS
ncbi:MAG: isochorismate synthase [Anaerolineae bacterium]|jgi:menaquinone-specific isochorismate synthase|nr:isochorismate synthase [Anaerolineae bacterium]